MTGKNACPTIDCGTVFSKGAGLSIHEEETLSVKIRLKRMGRLHRTSFRIVACDTRSSRDGEVVENLGSYDPLGKVADKQVQFDAGRVEYWISVGAQPTATVTRLLRTKGLKVSEVRAKVKAKGKGKDEAGSRKPE